MSAPLIPNLLTLRGRGGPRHGTPSGSRMSRPALQDKSVQDTDNDAAVSRMSAVRLGYLEDRFAQYMVMGAKMSKRLPIINRGTYIRTKALDRLVEGFLRGAEGGEERQIVSLGAGTDTRAFKLFSESKGKGLTYHELDFPVAMDTKLQKVSYPEFEFMGVIKRSLEQPETSAFWKATPAAGGTYYFHGVDLRDIGKPTTDKDTPVPVIAGLRTDIPTLILSECCLCYLETATTTRIITFFTSRIQSLGIALYEPTKPDDPFGQMMVQNFAARKIHMPTLESYRKPGDQVERLSRLGFVGAMAETMERLWKGWVAEEEVERVNELEILDEVEEWELLAGHYLVAWGWRGEGFSAWEELKA